MKKVWALCIGFIVTFVLLIFVSIGLAYTTAPSHYTVLFVGSDQRETERARSDVMFLVSVPKKADQQPFFLSIPRDTKVEDPEWGLQKMTHFYAFGDRPNDGKLLGNIDLTKKEIENVLGVHVDATVEVTFQSFQDIVDTLGGGSAEGKQLNGEEALALIRDRFTDGRSDFNRQADEREVLRSLLTKVKNPEQAKKLVDYFEQSDQARLRYSKLSLAHFALGAGIARRGKISIGEMDEASLPGTSAKIYTPSFGKELYYWIPDQEQVADIVNRHLQ